MSWPDAAVGPNDDYTREARQLYLQIAAEARVPAPPDPGPEVRESGPTACWLAYQREIEVWGAVLAHLKRQPRPTGRGEAA